jgi:hypothetical protein
MNATLMPAATVTGGPGALLTAILSDSGEPLRQMDQAEDEISRAQRRRPGQAAVLHHAFTLLAPAFPEMSQERVYRGHCRELLDRVAAGQDTRPGTAAEACIALHYVSLAVPLNTAGAGLYHRMWRQAFPGFGPLAAADRGEHYEHLEGPAIDDLEAMIRSKLARPWRQLGTIECSGHHHGTEAACPYAKATKRTGSRSRTRPRDSRRRRHAPRPATRDRPAGSQPRSRSGRPAQEGEKQR